MADAPARRVGLSLGHAAETLQALPSALDFAQSAGADSVELFVPAFGVILEGRVAARRLKRLADALAGRPMTVTLHGPLNGALGCRIAPDLQRAVTMAMIEIAAELRAPVIVQHATVTTADDAAAAMAREGEALAALAPQARQAGCVIGLETMFARPGEWTPLAGEIAAIVRAVADDAVCATLDFSHAWLNAVSRGADPLAEIAALAPHAGHLHLHDSFGRPRAFRPWTRGDAMAFGQGDLHLPPGMGALPWAALGALAYPLAPILNLELEASRWCDEIPDAVDWARRWAAGLARRDPPRRAAAAC